MPTRVLLSVKPQFAEAILAGEKTFEFRRLLFKRDDVRTIVLYASSPTCKVVGEFTLEEVLTLNLDDLWETTCHGGGIERSYFDEYFEGRSTGHALKVKRTRRYRSPLCLRKDFGISHPPQSFLLSGSLAVALVALTRFGLRGALLLAAPIETRERLAGRRLDPRSRG